MNEDFGEKKKAHRSRHSGRKADKKDAKKKLEQSGTDKQRNPKAYAFNSAVRAERRFRRKQNLDTKKQHIPLVDRTPIEPPPILIAVVGPPKVGKTTLINNLMKLLTKSPLIDIKGPVTIVTGKKRRITLIECNNDINSMIDLAKVADLVLLLSDASFGFEMEVFEFLNICQVHGMPRILGILTHLDMVKNSKTLKTTKKLLKHRFWTEVYPGAKLFYLSGIIHGEYLRSEIRNLARFISVIKLRPITWRTSHSYLLADRCEDITGSEDVRRNPKCDRNVCLYGYVRGVPLNRTGSAHIPGFGDVRLSNVHRLPDPCPLPEAAKKRALVEREKLIYAPFSGIGGIVYDKDAVYVELGGSHSHDKKGDDDETDRIVTGLIDTKETLDAKMRRSELRLFAGGAGITARDVEDEAERGNVREGSVSGDGGDSESSIDEGGEPGDGEEPNDASSDGREDSQSGSSDDENWKDIEELKWKDNLQEKAKESYLGRLQTRKSLMKIVYGVFNKKTSGREEKRSSGGEDEDEDEIFKAVSREQEELKAERERINRVETTLHEQWNSACIDRLGEQNRKLLANRFVTGKWKESEDAEALLRLDRAGGSDDSDVYGDFEDLESAAQRFAKAASDGEGQKEGGATRKREREGDGKGGKDERQELLAKKLKLKEQFNSEYDKSDNAYYDELKTSVEKQAQLNRSVFEGVDEDLRVLVEGFRPGMYVRIELEDVPSEFVANFDPTYPVIVGTLNAGEENIGYVSVKLKRHRWYKRILKANDPLIVSLGWRRFQTLPLYSKSEDNMKLRYLKYSPRHLSCNVHFWGPITPQGTGILALQSCAGTAEMVKRQGFRIAATGAVQELDKSVQVMKKLKLVGRPLKIHKKTAFVSGMFNSALEVAKFEGAKIKTVSGIRGQIKKAEHKPEGCFRATFEDKILLSDLVFCRTWYKVDIEKFYAPSTTLLLPSDQRSACQRARTVGELKREGGIRNEANEDSLYTEVKREPKVFRPLVIPKKLQQALPYRDKPKHDGDKKKPFRSVTVIKEPHEQKVSNVMKMIRTAYERKQERLKREMKERLQKHRQTVEEIEAKKLNKLREKKKNVFRAKSKTQSKANKD